MLTGDNHLLEFVNDRVRAAVYEERKRGQGKRQH
jgi:hypothetical protein